MSQLVKIIMLDTGPNRNRHKGMVYLVDEERAQLLIDGKHAERYAGPAGEGDIPKLPAKAKAATAAGEVN